MLPKIEAIRAMADARGLSEMRIQVDGGISSANIGDVAAAGADCFVAGSAIFGSNDYAATIQEMRGKAQLED